MSDGSKKQMRGFACMDPEKRREIASKGGKSVPGEKRSFSQNSDLATRAARKGGASVLDQNRSFSRFRDLASESGRKGGLASAAAKRAKLAEQGDE